MSDDDNDQEEYGHRNKYYGGWFPKMEEHYSQTHTRAHISTQVKANIIKKMLNFDSSAYLYTNCREREMTRPPNTTQVHIFSVARSNNLRFIMVKNMPHSIISVFILRDDLVDGHNLHLVKCKYFCTEILNSKKFMVSDI